MHDWRRHFFYRRVCLKTTWKLRIGVLLLVILAIVSTHKFWTLRVARSLACAGEVAPSDVIVVENFDPVYVVFERAAALEKAGVAPRALVPVQGGRDPSVPSPIFRGIAEVMARQARLDTWDVAPIQQIEPIS